MLINPELLDLLTSQAKASPRLRQNYDLRNSETDKSQRMLNAVEPGSIMPIHRHPKTSTTIIIIRGKIRQNFYDDNGNMVETVLLDANGLNRAVQIEKGRWHNLESIESGSVLFEAKDGEWEPYELFEK
ncbi:MAG: WbuC family cupin fold metalloprotein [Bacteroidales bacterium]|nr:WbuC family cupin fold metalloprotein [Candidatus Scybalocola fimicaballi]